MKKILEKIKSIDTKYIHILIIVLGIIFISLPVFHTSLWFDESYSVGMAAHSFKDIWTIGGGDVHPILYYWALHILNLIFGDNILAYRLFSTICMAILGIIGYTHIRKDFGEKIGLLFSFLVFFLPVNIVYSGEIRMYSMAMLLVSITAIYAYRIYKSSKDNVTSIKKWIIFAIFSLASAYTHYYGLVTVGLINLFLMIYLIIQSVKSKKLTKNLKMFIICAIAQIVLYIPWIVSLFTQMGHVSNSFWIYVTPNLFLELFTFYFTGNLKDSMNVSIPVAIIWSLFIEIYMIYLYAKDIRKSKKEKTEIRNKMRPAILSIVIFLSVIVAVSLVSVILWRPIIYARYMLCCMGLLMLFISYTMNVKGNKYINVLICIISVIMSLYLNIKFINTNYDDSNKEPISYIQEDISDEDIILVSNDGSGFVMIANFPRNTSYFWDQQIWNVEQAYKAFGIDQHTVYDLDCLKDYQGRIWVIGAGNYTLVDQIKDIYDIDVIKQETFSVKYKEYQYSISLIEKNN